MTETNVNRSAAGDCLLEVNNLVKWFPIKSSVFKRTIGNVKAVDGVSFKIKRGQTMGLVGNPAAASPPVGARSCASRKRPPARCCWAARTSSL